MQFTIRARATPTGPAVAPRRLLSPAQVSWKLLLLLRLLLPPRLKAPPAKPALPRTNRSATSAFVFPLQTCSSVTLTGPLSFNSLFRFSRATGAPSRDRGTTQVGSGITAAPTMTGTLAGPTTVTRATGAPPVRRHSTLTTQEVRPARPRPSTTRSVPLTTGCPKDNRGRTALDIGTPSHPHQELHQTCLLTLALPLPYYPHSPRPN